MMASLKWRCRVEASEASEASELRELREPRDPNPNLHSLFKVVLDTGVNNDLLLVILTGK